MNEIGNSQLELFSDKGIPVYDSRDTKDNPFFRFLKSYEKTLLALICIAAAGIISFSLGVEKGKKLSGLKADKAAALKPMPAKKQEITASPVQLETRQAELAIEQKEGYTIQLASFKTKNFAEKEAAQLKKDGYTPIILTKGEYVVVCVGQFPEKETAKTMLSKFQKRYKGCYVRRL